MVAQASRDPEGQEANSGSAILGGDLTQTFNW
jgi:hypothetical protein